MANTTAMPEWLARRASEELDWLIKTLRGRAPLDLTGKRILTQAEKAMGKTSPQMLAARATRASTACPGVGAWAQPLGPGGLERLAGAITLAIDLKLSHGTSAGAWRGGDAPAGSPADT